MDAQLPPEVLTIEQKEQNELICEKLLGWKQSSILGYWFPSPCHVGTLKTPSFTTWADAGLILDAITAAKIEWDVHTASVDGLSVQVVLWRGSRRMPTSWLDSAPLAIRAAALEYIRSLP